MEGRSFLPKVREGLSLCHSTHGLGFIIPKDFHRLELCQVHASLNVQLLPQITLKAKETQWRKNVYLWINLNVLKCSYWVVVSAEISVSVISDEER